jgi:hypothetical protein
MEIITKTCPICNKQFETKRKIQKYCTVYCMMARLARKNTARLVGLKETDPEAYAEYRQRENARAKRFRDGLSGEPNAKKEGLAERKVAKTAEYHKAHPEKKKAWNHNYSQTLSGIISKKLSSYKRRAATVGSFTASEWHDLCNKYDNKCLCCGEQKELTVDHVVSLKDGGSNTIDNLQPLCHSCNSRKGAKFIDYR